MPDVHSKRRPAFRIWWMYFTALSAWLILSAGLLPKLLPSVRSDLRDPPVERGHIETSDGRVLAHDQGQGRTYPQQQSGAALVGFVGRSNGLEGIEASHEATLRAGQSVTLTVHSALQDAAESALSKAARDVDAEFGSAVILEVRTGRIVAAATYPTFNPNTWQASTPERWRNRPMIDEYEPGSVMKPLIVAALLNEGLTTPGQTHDTPMRRQVGRARIGDIVPHPARLTTQQILRYSSNVGMTRLVEPFTPQAMYGYLQAFGFGRVPEVGIGSGRGHVRSPDTWDEVIRATNAFGQGLTVTTVQMAAAFNVLANDGQYVTPTLIKGKPAQRRQVLRPDVARTTRAMLHAVIDEGISTKASVPGYHVGWKTGTAQVAVGGQYSDRTFTSTFAGFLPADQPLYTVALMVRGAKRNYQGSQLAAPIFKEISASLISFYGLAPQLPHAHPATASTVN